MGSIHYNDAVIKEAKAEADALIEHTTDSEKNNLMHSIFDPRLKYQCIYGLLTGSCFNKRAVELLKKCAKPTSTDLLTPDLLGKKYSFSQDVRTDTTLLMTLEPKTKYFSAIETLIHNDKPLGLRILNYIKEGVIDPNISFHVKPT